MTSTSVQQTVTQLLHEQHEQVKEMFEQLGRSHGEARAELFDCLRATLAVHETAEEIVVHPVARATGDEGARVVGARLNEEDEAKRVLAELEKIGPDGDGFDGKLSAFERAALTHAAAEERELFPILEAHCDRNTLEQMANRVQVAEDMAPTHAHPHAPNSGTGNMLAGPFLAMADAVRDRLHR